MSEDLYPPPASDDRLAVLETAVQQWLDELASGHPNVDSVERDSSARRWFVRLRGEQKDVFTVWLTLDQRTFRYETYFIPSPTTNRERTFEWLLQRNAEMYGAAFCIGEENAVYLSGAIDVRQLDRQELDRIIGTLYAATERYFLFAARLAFGGRQRY